MDTIIISEDNINDVQNILHGMFNNQSTWENDQCVGYPIVHKVEDGRVFGKHITIDTKYGNVAYFHIGDKIEVFDNYIILHEDNEFIKFLLEDMPDKTMPPKKIWKKEFDADNYKKHLVDNFFWDLYNNFNSQIEFGKGMLSSSYEEGEEFPGKEFSHDESICYDMIIDIKNQLLALSSIPNIVNLNIKIENIEVSVNINWKQYLDNAEIQTTYHYKDKEFDNLIYVFFEL